MVLNVNMCRHYSTMQSAENSFLPAHHISIQVPTWSPKVSMLVALVGWLVLFCLFCMCMLLCVLSCMHSLLTVLFCTQHSKIEFQLTNTFLSSRRWIFNLIHGSLIGAGVQLLACKRHSQWRILFLKHHLSPTNQFSGKLWDWSKSDWCHRLQADFRDLSSLCWVDIPSVGSSLPCVHHHSYLGWRRRYTQHSIKSDMIPSFLPGPSPLYIPYPSISQIHRGA